MDLETTCSPRIVSRSMFDEGSKALRRHVRAEMPWGYGCPLCLRLFTEPEIGKLTRDHVPSRQIPGTHVIVLTCKDCNSGTGANLQHEMLKREHAWGSVSGTMFSRVKGEIEVDGLTLDMDFIHAAEAVDVVIPSSSRNTNEAMEQFKTRLNSPDRPDITVRTRDGYRDRLARVGLLREGYLAAFAAFGYRYALSEELAVVRDQINEPLSEAIPAFSGITPEGEPQDRYIGVARGEGVEGTLVVKIGRNLVFLPFERSGSEAYSYLGQGQGDCQLTLSPAWTWPRRPAYLLDNVSG